MRLSALVVIVLALTIPAISQADEPPAAPEQPAADSQAPTDAVTLATDKRMTVEVMIDGKGPYAFIVDTGSERTVIARELASQLALREGASSTLHGMGGSESVHTVVIPQLAANTLVVRKIVAPALAQYDLGAAGILGLDSLKSQRMLLDFAAGSMTLTPSGVRQDDWQGETIVITAHSRLGELILTGARIGDDEVNVILSTGNDVSVGNLALRQRLLAHHDATSTAHTPVALLDVTGNTIRLDQTVVDRLNIANLRVVNLPIAFADAHMFRVLDMVRTPTLLLGMDVLRMFGRVSIDFGSKKVRFQLREADLTAPSRRPAQSSGSPAPAAK
jgi:hypothetical protein